jgi:hypothetical protein
VPGVAAADLRTVANAPFTGGQLSPFNLALDFTNPSATGPGNDGSVILEDSGGTSFRLAAIAPAGWLGGNQISFAASLAINGPSVSAQQPFCMCFDIEVVQLTAEPSPDPNQNPNASAEIIFGFQTQFVGSGDIPVPSLVEVFIATTVLPPQSNGAFIFDGTFQSLGTWGAPNGAGYNAGLATPGTKASIKFCWDPNTITFTVTRDGVLVPTPSGNGMFPFFPGFPQTPPLPFLGYLHPYFQVSASGNQNTPLTRAAIADIRVSNCCINTGALIDIPLPAADLNGIQAMHAVQKLLAALNSVGGQATTKELSAALGASLTAVRAALGQAVKMGVVTQADGKYGVKKP